MEGKNGKKKYCYTFESKCREDEFVRKLQSDVKDSREMEEKNLSEKDLEVLKRYLKTAAKADSMEDFIKKMQ